MKPPHLTDAAIDTLLGGTTPAPINAMGAYEGADRFDNALNLWAPPLQSADADILPDKPMADARNRDMNRNDAYVQGGATLHKDNIVGSQFLLNAKPASRMLFGKLDDAWEAEFQEEVEEVFDLVSDSPDNLFDASRMNNFTGLIRLAVGIDVVAGEFLATVEWIKDGRPFNTAIQIVDLDRLSTPHLKLMDGSIRAGVRRNKRGAPQSYFIRSVHPVDYMPTWQNMLEQYDWKETPVRLPWGRLQVIHLFEQSRPDQTRGIAAMTAAIKEMRITHKLRDVNLQSEVARALFAATITSDMPSADAFQALGGGELNPASVQSAMSNYAAGLLGSINEYAGASKHLQVDGIRIPHLYPGTKLDLTSANKNESIGGAFEQSLLRYIAATLGVSYEQFSRDYTNTNYSSARAAMTETWKFMQARKKVVADRLATMIYRLWLEEAINADRFKSFPASKAHLLYTDGVLNLNFDAISRCEWIGASRGQIDELKETQAAVLRMNNGLSTAEDELARLGKDWRKVYRQIKREQDTREALNILASPTDTTNMVNASTGTPKDKTKPKSNGSASLPSVGTVDAGFADATPDEDQRDDD